MAIIVVGGHSRNIGKTSVASGIITALAELGWTAIKITQYGHGMCSVNGRECKCADDEHAFSILEERSRVDNTDSSRFLAAGAARAYWVRVKQGKLESALPQLLPIIQSDRFVMIESNSILHHLRPDFYIVVLRYDVKDWKKSARDLLGMADAAVLVDCGVQQPQWQEIAGDVLARIPVFPTTHPSLVPGGLVNLLRSQLLV